MKKHLPWILLGVYWPMVFVSTHIPRLPQFRIYGHDVTLHLAAYMILTWLYWFARYGRRKPHGRRWPLYEVVLLMALYGGLDETTQFLVHRHGDIFDWLSDMSGCFLALAALYLFRNIRWWLIFYWTGMLVLTCWPGKDPFIQLPTFLQQFKAVYIMMGYAFLTLLWWRSICPEPRFMFNQRILGLTLLILPGYALMDEGISLMRNRGFSWGDFFCATGGIFMGVICAAAFSRHQLVYEDSDAADSKSSTENSGSS